MLGNWGLSPFSLLHMCFNMGFTLLFPIRCTRNGGKSIISMLLTGVASPPVIYLEVNGDISHHADVILVWKIQNFGELFLILLDSYFCTTAGFFMPASYPLPKAVAKDNLNARITSTSILSPLSFN